MVNFTNFTHFIYFINNFIHFIVIVVIVVSKCIKCINCIECIKCILVTCFVIGLIALGVDPLHTNPNFGADWTKATSVKSKPLTVGSAEELIRKHFSEKAGFARKIGTTRR